MQRDVHVAGNRKTFTHSFWVKRSSAGSQRTIFSANTASSFNNGWQITFQNNDQLSVNGNSPSFTLTTTRMLSDPSAWYHIVVATDTTQSTASDRLKIYINGEQVTEFSLATYPSQNAELNCNGAFVHQIGGLGYTGSVDFDGYLADVHFIDGQALDETNFGEFDSNKIWQPKEFTGNYRTGVNYSEHTVCNGLTTSSNLETLYNSNTGTCQGIDLKGGHEASLILTYDIPNVTKITIHSNTGSGFNMIVNEGLSDEYSVAVPSQNNNSIADHFTGFTGTLHTLKLYNMSASVCLNAIAINDTVLVDGPGRNSFRLPFTDLTDLGKDSTFTEPTNMPTQGMEVVTWVGNGGTQTVKCGFQPDLVWIKQRNGTYSWNVYDSIRGATKLLNTNADGSEETFTNGFTAFNSDGFSLGNYVAVNDNNKEYAAWCWKGGGTAVTNTAGSVSSQVSANNDYGFSVVKYSLTGTGNETVGTGLNSKVKMLFTKAIGTTNGWACWHEALADTEGLVLSSSTDKSTVTWWDQSNMTDTVFAHKAGTTSSSGGDIIAYCWSEVPGYSKFGKIVHTSSTQKITFDFKPKFLLMKEIDGATDWYLFDLYRDNFDDPLMPNRNIQETSNWGFTIEGNSISWVSGSFYTGTHLYAAFADDPRGSSFEGNNLVGAANQYSSDITGTQRSGFEWTKMFNGNKDQGTTPNASSTMIWAPSPHIEFNELAIYAYKDSSPGTLRINGEDVTNQVPNHNGIGTNQRTVITGITSPLRTIEIESNGNLANIVFAGVEIDGGLLVDQASEIDSLRDSPTNYDDGTNIGGNYATINPLLKPDSQNVSLTNGNLKFESGAASGNYATRFATMGMTSGKWYAEFTVRNTSSGVFIGIAADPNSVSNFIGDTTSSAGYLNDGRKANSGSLPSYGNSYGGGDVIGIAFDADAGSLTFYQNGNSEGEAYSGLTSGPYFMGISGTTNVHVDCNFGQQPFIHTPPTNYKALCTQNLPDATFAPKSAFKAKAYVGNGSTQTIEVGFQPDLLWLVRRGSGYDFQMYDATRGFGVNKEIVLNKMWQQGSTGTGYANSDVWGYVDSVTSNGFVVNKGSHASGSVTNTNNAGYISWNWNAPTAFSNNANTNGASLASSGFVNSDAGFSIVKWTANGSNATVKHGLSVKPNMIIAKSSSDSGNWPVYHSAYGVTKYTYLNDDRDARTYSYFFNDTEPTSTIMSFGTDSDVGGNGRTIIALCFHAVEGFSAFGKYNGTGTTSGEFVYTGFQPAFIMHKRIDTGGTNVGDWRIWDVARDPYNPAEGMAKPNGDVGESRDPAHNFDLLSNGFRCRTADSNINATNGEFLYAAFAENPFKTARAR